jgi:arylsulfatase A-like enzyme
MIHTIRSLLISLLALAPAAALARSPAPTDRPNFIFILTDDQRYDALSCVQKEQGDKGRFPWFQTPNLDRIANEGIRFRNAFVTNSLCAPSRASFLTGSYNHVNGTINNHTPFREDNVSHATKLKQAGYTTAYFGKWHHGQQKERPGFDIVFSFIGQGKYQDCPFNDNGTIVPTTGWVDDVTTDHAIEFLKGSHDKPFDMVIGFKSPHDPRTPADRAKNRFQGATLRPVPNLESKTPYPFEKKRPTTAPAISDERRLQSQINHFRCISSIDDCVGKILDTLDELKLADNTVVVFASDNGYFFGEHGLADKRAAYEESMRIPLLMRYPKLIKPGTVSDALVLNIDYAPTILDLAGVHVPPPMQGKSLMPLFAKDQPDFRKAFFYEYFFEKGFTTPTMTAVRTPTMKLIKYPNHDEWTELYDLATDPYELHNLAQDPSKAELMNQMTSLHQSQAEEVKFTIPDEADKPQ